MRRLLVSFVVMAAIAGVGTARADVDEKAVAKLAGQISEKKGAFALLGSYPGAQGFVFGGGGNLVYRIDVTAHLCFAGSGEAALLVPCKVIKKSYPLIAPLITWDD